MSTECDHEASIVRGPWPTRGCRAIKRNVFMGRPYVIIDLKYAKEMPGSDTRKWGYVIRGVYLVVVSPVLLMY